MKLSIIIPVYNEEKTIIKILNKIKNINLGKKIFKEIIVIDDCSNDNTYKSKGKIGGIMYWGAGKDHREFKLRKWDGHFDGYDIWTNFAYKGDDNPTHHHGGLLSGVIYYKNHGHPTIFDEYGCAYTGEDGTMVMFPASTLHHVEPQAVNKERITLAFNIIENDAL